MQTQVRTVSIYWARAPSSGPQPRNTAMRAVLHRGTRDRNTPLHISSIALLFQLSTWACYDENQDDHGQLPRNALTHSAVCTNNEDTRKDGELLCAEDGRERLNDANEEPATLDDCELWSDDSRAAVVTFSLSPYSLVWMKDCEMETEVLLLFIYAFGLTKLVRGRDGTFKIRLRKF